MVRIAVLWFLFSIFALNCAPTVPVTKYLPQQDDNVMPFFTSGQPIASVKKDQAFLLLTVEPVIITRKPFVRLWVLYKNQSETPYLLEPQKFASIAVTSTTNNQTINCEPETPTRILAHVKNEKAMAQILQAIGGTLQAMSVEPSSAETRFSDGTSATTIFNDRDEKQAIAIDKTKGAMANTEQWYNLYAKSINEGILRRNTIFPGQSINGYIYFQVPRQIFNERSEKQSGDNNGTVGNFDDIEMWDEYDSESGGEVNTFNKHDYLRNMNLLFTLELNLSEGQQRVIFSPIEGE